MNSGRKLGRPTEEPLFKYDPETGKAVPLPRKLMVSNSTAKKESDKKPKRLLNIAPLNLTAADFEELPDRAIKMRKTDNSVRKELFTLPTKGSQMSRPSLNTRRTLSRRSIASKKAQQKRNQLYELSPLMDMEEIEDELIKKKGFLQGYPFKTPSKPAIKFTKDSKSIPLRQTVKLEKKNICKVDTTPDSVSSNEFLELEKMCCVDSLGNEKESDMSPVSSVCNLLEGTVINSSKKDMKKVLSNTANIQHNINDIENAVKEYKISHEKHISEIIELLETDRKQLESLQDRIKNGFNDIRDKLRYAFTDTAHIEPDKENTPVRNRRSTRLLNKSPVQSKNAKLVVSPVISRCADLRKSTLTKNLVTKTQQYKIESPRFKKALDMYNSMRSELSVLATPKLNRQYLNESPKSTNLSRNLSRRVQSQCLLLQDTPIHK